MKKIILALLVVLFVSVIGFARTVDIPPTDPHCADNESALCIQSCSTTVSNCASGSTFENGIFIQGTGNSDCNTTTCSWNCVCVKK